MPGIAVQGRDFLSPVTIYQGELETTSSASAWAAPVTEVDLYRVGVHRSRSTNGPQDPDIMTAYVDRDIDTDLHARVAAAGREGGLVLVVGGSAAGKTRAAWQAVATQLPDHRLLVPAAGADLAHLPARARAEAADCAGVVVWLDDMDRYLNTGRNLTAALVHTLTQQRVVVVATLRQGPYDTYRGTAPIGQGGAEELARLQAGQDLVRGVEAVRLERVWTQDELANGTRIAAERADVVLADAVARQLRGGADGVAEHGVAEYLAAAPDLVALWQRARDSLGIEGGHPRGHRLVAASVDLARIGVESADANLLEAAHTHYPLPASSRPEPFARALEWACAVRFGASGLLIPTTTDNTRWRPFDYLLDTATPIPAPLWDTALAHTTDPVGLSSLGIAAYRAELWATAETAWSRAAKGGNTLAMFGLGVLLKGRGEQEEAETWYRRGAEEGDTRAMVNLGTLLKGRGEQEEAETWYRRGAEEGDTLAMAALGALLKGRGEQEEAETWYRRGAEEGGTLAMAALGALLKGRGEQEEAETWYRRAAAENDIRAMVNLGILLQERGEQEEAEIWWRRGAEEGDITAMVGLGILLVARGEEEEAETWYRCSAEEGDTIAMIGLRILLKKRGESEEAEMWRRRVAETEATDLVLPEAGQPDG
ncbi:MULTISPECIES: tetratricopeptide repeat protein [Nocardiopsis]|uniref:Sel1 repeat family protein n=1 Tax=Nocardiopsis sinuspersici TaxID=501010 RepID=A0A1V3BUY7_9ACTN|nr:MULTISPECIES: tetratricopeptide repeat protein [Nocardiopsis]OOC52487.1 hypothetical protein NOSIN_00420 [Nocardiopsis sinuspersici]